ncbi:MAG: leucine-rich repeat domain-containing protein [Paludibacter sp.]|nr:leucine-rich repeat domain-containing protein [Paludibacter sp.]
MKHKILFLVFAFLCIVSITHAQTTSMSDRNIIYTLNSTDNTASITGNTIILPTGIVIPDTIRYKSILYKVTSIANNAFVNNYSITGKLTVLATSLKSIGSSSFSGCSGLTDTLNLPTTLTSIGTSAFAGCTGLKVISIPSGLISIAANTFQNCTLVSKIITPASVTTIGDYAFDGCTGLSDSIAVSSNVTSIGVSSFRNCNIGVKVDPGNPNYSSSKGVLFNKTFSTLIQAPVNVAGIDTIQSSVTAIGTYAFYKCTGLTGVVLPNSLTTIGTFAFSGCSKIATALNVPATVTLIGKFAFQGCSKITTVVSPTIRIFAGSFDAAATNFKLTGNIDARDFKIIRDSTSMNTLDLGSATIIAYTGTGGTNNCDYGLSTHSPLVSAVFAANAIPQFAFSYANTLTLVNAVNPTQTITGKTAFKSIVFPAALTTIDKYAFGSCTGFLGTFNIPSNIQVIGAGAFLDCAGITNFTLPAALTAIGDNAFERCTGLNQAVIFPSSLLTIGSYTYSACGNIPGSIDIPESVTTVGTYAFQSCRKITSITFPTTLKVIPAGICSNCDLLSNINFREGSTSIGANAFEYCTKLTSASIPGTVTTLGGYSFYECVGLTDISIPTTLTKIDTYTFYSCTGLKNITLPTALTTLGDYAFYNCIGLIAMSLPSTLKTLGQYTFSCCTKFTNITLPDLITALPNSTFSGCTGLTNVTLPSALASIGTYTFQNCNSLNTIVFPGTLKTIGDLAFVNCTALTAVTIPATVTAIGNYTFSNCSAPLFVDPANANYSSVDSILFNKAITTLIQCPVFKTGSYTIPNTVTSLGAYSFYFSKLKSVSIPSSVTSIGSAAFYNCSALQSIISNSASPVNLSNSNDVFYNLNSSCILYVPQGAKTQYQSAAQWNQISKIVEATTAVENPLEVKFTAQISNGLLTISNVDAKNSIEVYTLAGKLVSKTNANGETISLSLPTKGIYIVKVANQSKKITNY